MSFDPIKPAAQALQTALSGFCAVLVGNGLGRFAYTALLPAIIADGWFSPSAAAYLGAANLAGYLGGALLGPQTIRYTSPAWVLRGMMFLTAVSLFACARRDFGFAWFFAWRFMAGVTGGVIMVTGAPIVLSATPPARRGIVGGALFAGVGLGIAASGTIIPGLIHWAGLEGAWIGLGAVSLVLAVLGWGGWPSQRTVPTWDRSAKTGFSLPVLALLAEYGLDAIGLVPHMLFLVDYVARGLGRGLNAGALDWIVFGVAAAVGPLLAGQLADRVGFRTALRAVFCAQIVAVAIPVITSGSVWIMVSSAVVGAFVPGISTIVLGRIHELVASSRAQTRAWGYATTAWAIAQAVAAYGYSYLFGQQENYLLLFSAGVLALVLALGLEVAAGYSGRGHLRVGPHL